MVGTTYCLCAVSLAVIRKICFSKVLNVFLLSLMLQSCTDVSPREFNSASMPAVKLILCMKLNSYFIY